MSFWKKIPTIPDIRVNLIPSLLKIKLLANHVFTGKKDLAMLEKKVCKVQAFMRQMRLKTKPES